MTTLRRSAARAGLAALALAVLIGLWVIRISTVGGPWPATSHHPRVLPFIAAILVWIVVLGTAGGGLFLLVAWLWREAQ